MALHTKKLNYRRNGITEQIDLYTTTAEVGTEYIALRDGSTTVYAPIGLTTDSRASFLRVFKGNIKAIMKVLVTYTNSWTATIPQTNSTRTYNYNYNKLYSSSVPYNVVIYPWLNMSENYVFDYVLNGSRITESTVNANPRYLRLSGTNSLATYQYLSYQGGGVIQVIY